MIVLMTRLDKTTMKTEVKARQYVNLCLKMSFREWVTEKLKA